jgi:hypothetical protein
MAMTLFYCNERISFLKHLTIYMDYRRAIGEMYPTARFFVEKTYDSLVWWKDTQKPKKKTY